MPLGRDTLGGRLLLFVCVSQTLGNDVQVCGLCNSDKLHVKPEHNEASQQSLQIVIDEHSSRGK